MSYAQRMQNYKDLKRLGEIIGFAIPVDGLLTAAAQVPKIDIFKFDDLLIEKFDYEYIGYSMAEFILKAFGKEAHDLTVNLI